MVVKKRSGPMAERFVDVTLELIEERGGSQDVNLREVARRVGCAHTNVYNYFDGFPGLLWESMRRAVVEWARSLATGLSDEMEPLEYFGAVISNFIAFPIEHPGLYRFITSDPVNDNEFPDEVLQTVGALKEWFTAVIEACAPGTNHDDAEAACYIIDAYISGESASLITNRVLPGEDVARRMHASSIRLFTLLTTPGKSDAPTRLPYPRLELPGESLRTRGR